eukprot:gene19240-21168_t
MSVFFQKPEASTSMRVKGCKIYDVVIVGNGPSAISLSYFLSGNWPYYNGTTVPDPLLNARMQYCGTDVSLVEQLTFEEDVLMREGFKYRNLEELSDGLYDSRSNNPVSILFDKLNHPNADFMTDDPVLFDWRNDGTACFKHLALGLGPPGGTWHRMSYSQYSLSLNWWLELPGFPFKTWYEEHNYKMQTNGCACNLPKLEREIGVHEDRVLPNHVALYYSDYVKRMKLDNNFLNNVKVTSVKRVGPNNPIWEVSGQMFTVGSTSPEPFKVCARNVVLAVGAYSRPKTLGIPGENLKFVQYDLPDLDDMLNGVDPKRIDPVVVVGCGLVALDAVLAFMDRKIPVFHVFRRDAKDQKLIVNQLPSSYPDYLKLKPLMTGRGACESYTPFAFSKVTEILPGKQCVIEHLSGKSRLVVNTTMVLVQIGSKPNLSFLGDIDNLAVDSSSEVDVKENPIDVDMSTYESQREQGLYAIGPLVGDNFVRFIVGGALAVTHGLVTKSKKEKK